MSVDLGYRVRSPEQTWAAFGEAFERVGITRVAELTRLDRIGIPVFQAVRPTARSLTLSQGKGLSAAAARTGAAMESTEVWHAECPRVDQRAPVQELAAELPYDLGALARPDAIAPLPPARIWDWTVATSLVDGTETVLPTEAIRFDLTMPAWPPRALDATTNGLASGNTMPEAQLHAILEVIERASVARTLACYSSGRTALRARMIDLDTVTGRPRGLVEAVQAAGCLLTVADMTADLAVATLVCVISASDTAFEAGGLSCHPDRELALCRAICEAAQSRLTMIAGARDDIDMTLYQRPRTLTTSPVASGGHSDPASRTFSSVPTTSPMTDAGEEVERLVEALALRGHHPLVADLTEPEIGVPVAKVVVPTLDRFDF